MIYHIYLKNGRSITVRADFNLLEKWLQLKRIKPKTNAILILEPDIAIVLSEIVAIRRKT